MIYFLCLGFFICCFFFCCFLLRGSVSSTANKTFCYPVRFAHSVKIFNLMLSNYFWILFRPGVFSSINIASPWYFPLNFILNLSIWKYYPSLLLLLFIQGLVHIDVLAKLLRQFFVLSLILPNFASPNILLLLRSY